MSYSLSGFAIELAYRTTICSMYVSVKSVDREQTRERERKTGTNDEYEISGFFRAAVPRNAITATPLAFDRKQSRRLPIRYVTRIYEILRCRKRIAYIRMRVFFL